MRCTRVKAVNSVTECKVYGASLISDDEELNALLQAVTPRINMMLYDVSGPMPD